MFRETTLSRVDTVTLEKLCMKREFDFGKTGKLVSLVGAASLALASVASPAIAEEEATMEEVIVTGSRIKTDEYTGISPVITIDSEDIAASGYLNVADVLRNQVQNTLGSSYEGFNSTSTVDAEISLRGIGAARTLVLIDGRRLPGSPKNSGAASNLNMVPTELVDRVEILTDGASAVYGGDASGGVVNIITKKDFEGISFTTGLADPDREGGGRESDVSVVFGAGGEKTHVVFSYEHQKRKNIFWKDREYTRSANLDTGDLADALNVSQGSRTWINLDTFQYLPMEACVDNPNMVNNGQLYYDSSYPGDASCLYDYTEIGSDDASRESDAISTQMTYRISDSLEATLRGTFSRVKGDSRFAPAVGTYAAPAGSLDVIFPTYNLADGSTLGPNADYSYTVPTGADVVGIDSYVVAPSPVDGLGLVRFDGAGNRDMETVGDMLDLVFALDGTLDSGWYYNLTLQHNEQQTAEWGYNYINKTAYEGLLEAGEDPLLAATVDKYRTDVFEKATNEFDSILFGIGKRLTDTIDVYFGAEYFEFDYQSRYDAVREGKNAIGSAGNSSAGQRDSTSFFGEMQYYVSDRATVSLSARHDDYSDFGTAVSWRIGGAYDLRDDLTLRGSYGSNFIPPSMTELYGADSESYPFTIDYVACDAVGTSEEDCKGRQYASYTQSATNLDAETSENLSLGLVYQPLENLQLRVEYYDITIEDAISVVSIQALVNAEREGAAQLAALEAATGSTLGRVGGKLSTSISQPSLLSRINTDAEFKTSGVDFAATYQVPVGPGTAGLDIAYTQIMEYEGEEYFSGPVNDKKGRFGIPEYRYNVTANYAVGDHTVSAVARYVDETAENIDSSYNKTGNVEDQTRYDVSYSWDHPWGGQLQVGCRNCTDEDPPLKTDLSFDRGLFNNRGRMYFVQLRQSF